MNLYKNLRIEHGQETVKLARDYENVAKKIARHRNHLTFSHRCKDSSLTPPSLKLKCPIRSARARDIIAKAEKELLRERIRVTHNKIGFLDREKSTLVNKLQTRLPEDTQRHLASHIERKAGSEFNKTKCRQVNKFARLQEKVSKRSSATGIDLSGSQLKKWVVNISQYKLDKDQERVLAKGLNFAVSPEQIPYDDFIVATEKACWGLPQEQSELLRAEIAGTLKNAKPPKSNLDKGERRALKSLQKEKSILILPADKGKATVVVNTNNYEEKVNNLLQDGKTYEKMDSNPTSRYKKTLVDILKRLKKGRKIE